MRSFLISHFVVYNVQEYET